MSPSAPRILVVTPQSPEHIGGVERHVRETTVRLARGGVPVQVLCADPHRSGVHDAVLGGVPIRSVPGYPRGTDLLIAPRLWREIETAQPDLIHVQSYHTFVAPLAMARARRLGIPYVLTFHGGGSSAAWRNSVRASQRRAQRSLYAGAAALIAIARFELELYARELALDRSHFVTIPNGTDVVAAADGGTGPAAPKAAGDAVTIASIGRLEAYKGHQRAIAAMPELVVRRPGARLLIVGQGPFEQELRAIASASTAADRISFTSVGAGDGGGMAKLLSEVDLVLLMSEFETHPLVALEAAAMRRRLVVADTSGLAELAARGFAQPVPLELPADLVAAVVDRELSKPAPTKTPPPYDWDDCTADLLALYERTARRR